MSEGRDWMRRGVAQVAVGVVAGAIGTALFNRFIRTPSTPPARAPCGADAPSDTTTVSREDAVTPVPSGGGGGGVPPKIHRPAMPETPKIDTPAIVDAPDTPSSVVAWHGGEDGTKVDSDGFEAVKDIRVKMNHVMVLGIHKLQDTLPELDAARDNIMRCTWSSADPDSFGTRYQNLISDDQFVLADLVLHCSKPPPRAPRGFIRAGPRPKTFFDPTKVVAAVVTCGGLCPGLNRVIREVVRSVYRLYNGSRVWGVRNGFHGFHTMDPIDLTCEVVRNIHEKGGTILKSDRGGFDVDKIIAFLQHFGINQLYIVGGDGTHRAANAVFEAIQERRLPITVTGIPKTIDNDVGIIDRTFGFETAVEQAQVAIHAAQTEASCVPNGVGIVKLMGRSAGFITAHATLCSGVVDLCLLPELPLVLDGEDGALLHVERVLERKGYCVIVVAEGAGEELLQSAVVERDAGGNRKLPKIGLWLKERVVEHFQKKGTKATVKYIDPSYTVRSVPANPKDSLYCMMLAQNAVHGAMAGYTGFSVGLVNNKMVMVPLNAITENSPRTVNPFGRTIERVVAMTHQPLTLPPKE